VSDPSAGELQAPILIAGFGSIGQRHFRNLKSLGCKNFILYRTRQGTLKDELAADCRTTSNLDEALSWRPRMAIVSNPTSMHMPVALAAARAGCDLFLEKPLSHELTDCGELTEQVRAHSLVTMIGCQFRFHPLLGRLRAELQAGRLGTVVSANAEWGEYLPAWHPWEDHRKSYSARSDLGGGVILTLIHPLDYLYWLFGPVGRLHASTRAVESLGTQAGEDCAEIIAEFVSGPLARVHLDYFQRPPKHTLTVAGDAGSATIDFHAQTLTWQLIDGSTTVDTAPADFERNTMFVDEMRHFLTAVEQRAQTDIPLADGVAVLDIALRAKTSAQETRSDV
jgi:predicted dehydrogenase